MNDVPKPKSIQKATYKTMMFGAREPKPRPTAQDRQPMILATRHPKRLTTTPITGPKNRNIAIMIELTHAVLSRLSLKESMKTGKKTPRAKINPTVKTIQNVVLIQTNHDQRLSCLKEKI